jgi:hypothetical protein
MRLEFTAGVNEPGYLPITQEEFPTAKEAWQFLADDFEAHEDLGLEDDGEVRQFAAELRAQKGEAELKGPDGLVYFVLEVLSYA